jgi:hypothetical protein
MRKPILQNPMCPKFTDKMAKQWFESLALLITPPIGLTGKRPIILAKRVHGRDPSAAPLPVLHFNSTGRFKFHSNSGRC